MQTYNGKVNCNDTNLSNLTPFIPRSTKKMISINDFSNIVSSVILIVCIVVSFSNPRALVKKKIVEKANDEQLAEYTKLISNSTIIFIAVF